MQQILILKVAIAIIGAIVFAFYDLFNKRTIPDKVAYSFLAISLILTFFNELQTIEISLMLATIILLFGYLLYRKALIGLGDIIELAAISLLLPYFFPIYPSVFEKFVKLPFFVALFLNSGIFAVVLVAISLPFKIKKPQRINRKRKILALLLFLLYFVVAYLLKDLLTSFGIGFIVLLGISASLLLLYAEDFKEVALKKVKVSELEIGDIIKPIPKLGNQKLVTKQLLEELKKKKIKKVEVYRNLPPFSLFILLGLLAAILFGNILFWVAKI